MRRFTRLTNAFSKKIENHACAVALHCMYFFFFFFFFFFFKKIAAISRLPNGSTRFVTPLGRVIDVIASPLDNRLRHCAPISRSRSSRLVSAASASSIVTGRNCVDCPRR